MDDLNHPKVQPFSRSIAHQLGLEPKFVDFVFSSDRPKFFEHEVESVEGSWTAIIPPNVTAAYPLWSTNADQMLVCVDSEGIWFGRGWHDGSDDPEYISKSVQGLLASLFVDQVDPDGPMAEYVAAAERCGFRYLPDVVSFLAALGEDDGSFAEMLWRFIKGIDARAAGER